MEQKVPMRSRSINYKLVVAYAMMYVIPMMYLLYAIGNVLEDIKLETVATSPAFTILVLAVVTGLIMSIAAFLLIYRSVKPIREAAKNLESFFKEVGEERFSLVPSNDETEKISQYISSMITELRKNINDAANHTQRFDDARWKLLSAIRDVTSKVSEAKSFDVVINAIIQIAADAMRAEIFSILLYSEEKNGLEIIASKGLSEKVIKNTVIDSDDRISWWVFKEKEPTLIEDLRKQKKFKFSNNPIYKGNSLMCVPIKTSEEVLGVCTVTNHLTGKPFAEENLETLVSMAGQIAIIVDNEIYHQKLIIKMAELETLYQVSEQVSHSLDLRETLKNIAKLAVDITKTNACSLRLLNLETNELDVMACVGVSTGYMRKGSLKIGEGVGGYVAKEGVAVAIPNLKKDKRVEYTSYLEEEGLMSLVSVPIKSEDGNVVGIISVYRKEEHEFPKETVELLSTFANNVSVAIKNARLFETIKRNYYDTIQSLALALEARDKYTRGHSERVTDFAVRIAEEMGISESEIETLRFAGKLHDIGKIAIPDSILLKKGKLTLSEYADIKAHPVKGTELLEPLEFLKNILPHIKHHHERYDGKGYPEGLSENSIPVPARILAVADAFDAMTSERPYRNAMPEAQALEELEKNVGSQFDPQVVAAFKNIINK